MTVLEVIRETATILNNISIPVAFIDSIGRPIMNAVGNLTLCMNVIKESQSNETPEERTEEEMQDGQVSDAE